MILSSLPDSAPPESLGGVFFVDNGLPHLHTNLDTLAFDRSNDGHSANELSPLSSFAFPQCFDIASNCGSSNSNEDDSDEVVKLKFQHWMVV